MKSALLAAIAAIALTSAAFAFEPEKPIGTGPTTNTTPTGYESVKEHKDRGKNVNAPTTVNGDKFEHPKNVPTTVDSHDSAN